MSPKYLQGSLKVEENIRRGNQRDGSMRWTLPDVVDFKDAGRGARVKDSGQPLKVGNGRKIYFLN